MSPKTRKLLMVIRAALIMATKAIEEYCKDDTILPASGDNVTIATYEQKNKSTDPQA